MERDLVELRDVALKVSPIPGRYDFAHLGSIHRWLFQDVYTWAGKERTIDIAKGGSLFCLAQHIAGQAPTLLAGFADAGPLPREPAASAARLAFLLGELNALHPFREGNGRTQRAFLWQYALGRGWKVDWSGLDPAANVTASMAAMAGSCLEFADLLEPLLSPVLAP